MKLRHLKHHKWRQRWLRPRCLFWDRTAPSEWAQRWAQFRRGRINLQREQAVCAELLAKVAINQAKQPQRSYVRDSRSAGLIGTEDWRLTDEQHQVLLNEMTQLSERLKQTYLQHNPRKAP